MRAVIYDAENYEPLTVIDIPQAFVREIESGKRGPVLRFPVRGPVSFGPTGRETVPELVMPRSVTVRFETIYKGRQRCMWLCTTVDAESALLLRAAFLPGQQGEVNRQLDSAFLKGLLAAVSSDHR